jgi:serine/threonine protein kinase
LENEVLHLTKCHHYNVLQLYEAYRIEERSFRDLYFLVTEPWADASFDLFFTQLELSQDGTSLACPWYIPEQEGAWPGILTQCISGLEHLHQNSIRHKDLKPGNVLLLDMHSNDPRSPNIRVIIADFGISKATTVGAPTTFLGTHQFMAPEQLARESSTPKSDIFSLGTIFAFILEVMCTKAGRKSWMVAKQRQQDFFAVCKSAKGDFGRNANEIVAILAEMASKRNPRRGVCVRLLNLLRIMLALDPSHRPDADALKEHLFPSWEVNQSNQLQSSETNPGSDIQAPSQYPAQVQSYQPSSSASDRDSSQYAPQVQSPQRSRPLSIHTPPQDPALIDSYDTNPNAGIQTISFPLDPGTQNSRAVCTICGTRFLRQSELKRHTRHRHTLDKDKPKFFCGCCLPDSVGWDKLHKLKAHKKTHGLKRGSQLYECVEQSCRGPKGLWKLYFCSEAALLRHSADMHLNQVRPAKHQHSYPSPIPILYANPRYEPNSNTLQPSDTSSQYTNYHKQPPYPEHGQYR